MIRPQTADRRPRKTVKRRTIEQENEKNEKKDRTIELHDRSGAMPRGVSEDKYDLIFSFNAVCCLRSVVVSF